MNKASAVFAVTAFAGSAYAALVPTTVAIADPTATATFNEFTGVTNQTSGVNVAGDETVFMNGDTPLLTTVSTYQAHFGLANNGDWYSPKQFAGMEPTGPSAGLMRFTFTAGDVSGFSAFINYGSYANAAPVILTAYDDAGAPLGAFDVSTDAPISTPGATDDGAFRGLSETDNTIHSFTISGQYVALDDLSFTRAAPEPASLAALSVIATLGLRRRRTV